jgi:hypothetical protein
MYEHVNIIYIITRIMTSDFIKSSLLYLIICLSTVYMYTVYVPVSIGTYDILV